MKTRTNFDFSTNMGFLREFIEMIREGNGNPLQYSCLENPMDRGA